MAIEILITLFRFLLSKATDYLSLELSWHPLLKSDRDVNKACQLVTIVDHNSWMIFSKAPPQTKLPIDWLYVWRTTLYNDHPLIMQMFLLSLVDVVILSSGNIVLTPRITRLSKLQLHPITYSKVLGRQLSFFSKIHRRQLLCTSDEML